MLENLKAATFEVLETMFFLFPEAASGNEVGLKGDAIRAWVPVTGPKSFKVGLTAPLALTRKMAANFLGLEEERASPDSLEDMLREAANMVAGNFLSREQVSEAFHPETPHSQKLNFGAEPWLPQGHSLLLMVDDNGLEIFLERTE